MMIRAKEVIRLGLHEADVAAELAVTLACGSNGKPCTSFPAFSLNSGPHSATSDMCWTRGTNVNLGLSGSRYYAAPLSSTFSIGTSSEYLRRVHEAQLAGLEALNVVRPTATCSDVDAPAYRGIEKQDLNQVSRFGYAVVIDWVEQTRASVVAM